jgi:glyoxylase-like metal-dependent hydrolase (beta-lactamase superfamily II)/rhodanese-related sulfurtransferase
MKIEQIYTGCLAQGAYYIESNREVAIIDPLRETQPYLDKANADGAKIKYILETHFHADFVSGHIDLAKESGGSIVFGPTAKTNFEAIIAKDGERFKLGQIEIEVLHTPGHTMESSCFLVYDEAGKPHAIFTGDTLFIGDVGRPDLAVKNDMSQEDLAGYLYESLKHKILPLPDSVIVYPGHGAGSACGKNMSKETWDLLGNQKKMNYALNPSLSKEAFIQEVTKGLIPPPAYFPKNVVMNKMGYTSVHEVLDRGVKPLSAEAFEFLAEEEGALILDIRDPEVFAKGFIPNSINIGINGNFAPWAGTLIPDIEQKILLVGESESKIQEAVIRLARVGYDFSIGYLSGGFEAWVNAEKETDSIVSITPEEAYRHLKNNPEALLLDVRKKSEYDSERVEFATNAPLDFVNDSMLKTPKDKEVLVHCAGGYRSMIYISILQARGYRNLINIQGGFGAIKQSNQFPLTDYVCPKTLL